MKRSIRAEHTAWQKYKKWQKEHIDEIREGQVITSLGEFKEIYRQAGRRISVIKQEVRFQTYGRTFAIFSRVYKSETGQALPPEARKKSTYELAAILQENINKFRTEMRGMGKTAAETRLLVSEYFFGS